MSLPKPYYQDEWCTIYHADVSTIIDDLPGADLLITDPPYGLNGGSSHSVDRHKCRYTNAFEDTPQYIESVIVPSLFLLNVKCKRAIITPGQRCNHLYEQPDDIGFFYHNSSATWARWGQLTGSLIYYYGKDPRCGKRGTTPNGRYLNEAGDKNGHPCPKPIEAWMWLVNKGSLPGETVIDPLVGSGTTLVCAKSLNRKSIGVDIEERYCEIAAQRCSQGVLELWM